MHAAHAAKPYLEIKAPRCSVDRDIRDFLAGKNAGERLLRKLYDHVLDETIPERLTAILRR